jgi:GH35 family endo-1,4-beta-xylanase
LHHSFFEDKLGTTASARFYRRAQTIDGTCTLFMNEYNTIEDSRDWSSKPDKYLQKLKDIRRFPGNGNLRLGIGLQGHFSYPPDLSYIRASIDTLASTGLSIWITELDVKNTVGDQQVTKKFKHHTHTHTYTHTHTHIYIYIYITLDINFLRTNRLVGNFLQFTYKNDTYLLSM